MSRWSQKMTSVVSSCGRTAITYQPRLEKVKFGIPLEIVCKTDIPGPLLVMLLKLNKEGPFKKDVFRAPGQHENMRKLIHFLQHGRLVNIHNFSVNTIASVLKKFLRKIPGGIFGAQNETKLFEIVRNDGNQRTLEDKLALLQGLFLSLPSYSQHLLVLLFGTFRVIHSNCIRAQTGMTAEALGVSVAPSFFHTCVLSGKNARMEDVERYKLATQVITLFISHFGMRVLFGRENYEYYARLTGRILKVEDEWIFFTYPSVSHGFRDDMEISLRRLSSEEGGGHPIEKTGSLEIIHESCPLDPQGRLSMSLDIANVSSPSSTDSRTSEFPSYFCLPQVHQRQTERMKHRSEWFLSDPTGLVTVKCRGNKFEEESKIQRKDGESERKLICSDDTFEKKSRKIHTTTETAAYSSSCKSRNASDELLLISHRRRSSDKEKRLSRKSSSSSYKRKNKENGGEKKEENTGGDSLPTFTDSTSIINQIKYNSSSSSLSKDTLKRTGSEDGFRLSVTPFPILLSLKKCSSNDGVTSSNESLTRSLPRI